MKKERFLIILHSAAMALAQNTGKQRPFIYFGIVFSFSQPVFGQFDAGANRYFRTALQSVRNEFNIPALGGVLVVDGKTVVAGSGGVRKQGSPVAVTDNDRFPIGSITKTFTGFVAARLTQPNNFVLGLLTWETRIRDVFPDLANTDGIQSGYLDKTLVQLTTHQADLPDCSKVTTCDESTSCDKTDFMKYMICGRNEHMVKNLKLTPMPAHDYSNLGPVIVANMAQKRTGKTWEELVRQYIYAPLNLSAGFITTTEADIQWHVENGSTTTHVPYSENDKYNIAAPAGHVTISPKDMGRYLIELMPGAANRVGALKATTLNQYLEQYNANRQVTRGGWVLDADNAWAAGEKILWHNGSHGLNYSIARLLPDAKVAFCAMANSSCNIKGCMSRGVQAADKLNEHFKRMWYNKNVLPFFDDASSFSITASGSTGNADQQIAKIKDTDMLTMWKADAPGSSLQMSIRSALTSVKALVFIYPRNQHNIKQIKIFAQTGNTEMLIHTEDIIGKDNSVFEFEPALATNKLRIEFENLQNKSTQIAEALLIYNDPLKRMNNKLKELRAIDKRVIQPPPVLRIKTQNMPVKG